ncbi:hypothetical protein E0L36_22540 [Streptomyces sp. AJS327]|uniref:hypothetical protein n=1 Tax=Streptomyces sp. AJS327 TaxID=2545265 RepID=UPI0015DFA9C5|nr:hypothetical protein [Streptomyces sp. AJS327]MBA0053554.1 hypothetical protein [Streptomyces sp. AJS327]
MTGASGDGKEYRVRGREEVLDETERKSSEILDLMKVKARVTKPGAGVMGCSGSQDERTYRGWHPWSIWDVSVEELNEVMERLRRSLPKAGWAIVKDGHDNTPAKSEQILAESRKDGFAVDIRLRDRRQHKKTSIISVTVNSLCYRFK